ncbi:MAG: response regulator [Candidatus Marinimicrobia bacterium]|jgi:CheY-like chemotaxis protein|nr:response regulator [Candidatus Neomarinimicrobiota bacterium]
MRKVLFVDDEIGFLENLQMLFSGDPDLEIAVVSEPEMALHKAISFKPELIFLDVSMPKMDGGELAVMLRENAITKQIPIVFITAVVTSAERGVHGGQIFLPKPIKSAEIKAIVKELLG